MRIKYIRIIYVLLTMCILSCVKYGNADFETINEYYIASFTDTTLNVNHQGIIDNSLNRLTVKIPYKNGRGIYEAYTGEYVINFDNTGENNEFNKFRISYPSGTFTNNGYLDVTIEVDGNQNFNVLKLFAAQEKEIVRLDLVVNGMKKGDIIIKCIGGIPDRNFQDTEHRFIYLPVLAKDGNIWLNNNLGANYSNLNSNYFDLLKKPQNYNDINAYGSLFQWGRFSDGHEIIDYKKGEGKRHFINELISNKTKKYLDYFVSHKRNWSVFNNNDLWNGNKSKYNPCPKGFKIPTTQEFQELIKKEKISNLYTGFESSLNLVCGGRRLWKNGSLRDTGTSSIYWTSTVNVNKAEYIIMNNNIRINKSIKTYGYSCRCIKN